MRFLRYSSVLVALVMPAGIWAQTAAQDTTTPQPVPAALDSPQSTMFTFLRAVNAVGDGQTRMIDSAIATFDLAAAGVGVRLPPGRVLARELWTALNHLREVQASELPDAASLDPSDSTFLYFPRPFNEEDESILERVDVGNGEIGFTRADNGRWLFSGETLAGIGALSTALGQLPEQVQADVEALEEPAWVRDLLPLTLRRGGLLGLRPWQWLGLVVVIFLGFVADFLVRGVVRPAARRLAGRLQQSVADRTLDDAVKGTGLFVAAIVWTVLVRVLYLPDPVDDIAASATGFFAVLAGTLAGWRLADLVAEVATKRAEASASKFDDVLVPLVRKTVKMFILALGIVYGAQNLNINIVPLLTGLGIGGLAFAFAAKDTIENLFGSIAVVLDRPFEVGDWVVIGDVEGTVEELGFRSTRIRTFYNSQITMPNAALVRATVDNYGRRTYRRWSTKIGVQYDTTPEQLLAFTEGIREFIRQHPYTRKDYYQVWCNDFASSSIDVLVYIFHEVPDWSTELRERERLMLDIMRLADRLGVQFAFPTQTLHIYQEEHGTADPQLAVPGDTSDTDATATGAAAAQQITAGQPWQREAPGAVTYPTGAGSSEDKERLGGDE